MIAGIGRAIQRAATVATTVAATPVVLTVGTGMRLASGSVGLATRLTSLETLQSARTAATEFVGGRPGRRYWRGDERCWIEVRGLQSEHGSEIGAAVARAVRAQPGIRSAKLNYPLSRIVVEFDDSSETPDVRQLSEIVAAAETCGSDEHAASAAELPGDGIALAGKVIAAAANGAGVCVATAGRALMLPRLPAGLTAAVTLVDYQPRVRSLLESRLGPQAADATLAIAAATVYALTQSPAAVAVEFVRHLSQVAEAVAASNAWQVHEPALASEAECADTIPAPPRPHPLPAGAVERHAEKCARAQAVAAASAGVLARNLNTAATAAVVTAPKAGRNAREAFASSLGRGLAERFDVLPVRPRALRMLDRIDAVVVDPRVLVTDELRVGQFRDVAERDRAAVWQWAQDKLDEGALSAGWHTPDLGGAARNGRAHGKVLVRHAHDPLAQSLLGEIRRAGAHAVSLDLDELGDLRSSFDDLYPPDGGIDAALAGAVDALQRNDRTVAVLSVDSARALRAADLGVGLLSPHGGTPWHADLLAGDLEAVWRILHAMPAARRASERGVELATSGSLLGALLMIPGVRGVGPGPVTAGAAAGLATGFMLARGVLLDPAPAPAPVEDWHAMTPDQVQRHLAVSERAQPQEVSPIGPAVVRRIGGSVRQQVSELATALRGELSDPLTPVLAVGSAASALLGSPVDAVLVGSVLTGNAVLAATQQVRAERLLRRLLAVQDPPARRVVGDGYQNVPAARLRPGDVIEVRAGEVVPADARIISAVDVEADEAALTGESLPVAKQVDATPGAVLAERHCMIHAATTLVTGTAVAVVTEVGAQTQARRAADIGRREGQAVGLQSQLRELTNRALPYSLAGGALVSGLGVLRKLPLRSAVASGVAVAVAAVPEGLPLVATLAQQASARRLTRAGALVRSPRSVEALGRVDVVCFDKTGTLSENRLRVSEVQPAGKLSREEVLDCGARATPPKNGDHHEHATDAAVAEAGRFDFGTIDGNVAYLPFRSGRKFSASVIGEVLSIKGAPEVVLAACGADAMAGKVDEMARSGLRVIAVARRVLTPAQAERARAETDDFADLCREELELVGLLGLSDTPRSESAALLKSLRHQGIGVRLITGDHPVTAKAIAAELGMPVTADQVMSGEEWVAMPRRSQERAVAEKRVFARMSPEHKVQIVQTLERTGQVCAMVGDGANDAAAIRAATVGIGVASRGSDPARSSADVLLLDGRIGALVDALDEGRHLWRRVQAAVSVLLGGNAGEVVFSIIGSALTGRSPLNTRQLLLVNMMTDALPAAALAVSPATRSVDGAGHGPDQAALWRTVAIRGATTAGAATGAWLLAGFTLTPRRASTVALVALVSTQLAQTLIDSHSPLVVTTAAGSLLLLGALISTPGVSQLLGCTPLGPVGWTNALAAAGVATAAAAVAPRLVARFQSSISTTPQRHNTAYSSRNGMANARVTTSVNGSALTTHTVRRSSVEKSKTT
ncbi:cation-translocating P-type ATPase [Mycolicibacterium goodii]|uniref:Haloacid dehalogenase n=1 Tax=Mycolicibacterium wolinskyi TaxID=59750 RepID=A0A1X2ESJ3_9MYCO|nr:cation-translocating P-type ATPase [Mycolicibacterium wolinskyi]ORX09137.1 haloacid dehalogenase [Mycolicibacterium wolinskyi]